MTFEKARMIVQHFLDRQGDVTVAGDIEATLGWCDLPCRLETPEGEVIATTEAEMRAICEGFIQLLKTKHMTHMIRRCLEARFLDETTICASYETRYVREGAQLAEDSYFGLVVLRRRASGWKFSSMQFADDGSGPAAVTLKDHFPDAPPAKRNTAARFPD